MKKYLFLIASFVCVLEATGQTVQKEVVVGGVVNISFPAGVMTVSKSKLDLRPKTTSKGVQAQINTSQSKGSFYESDGVFMNLNAVSGSTKMNHHVELKKGLDDLYSLGKDVYLNYSSVIKNVNGNSVLIQKYYTNNKGYYRINCTNERHTSALSGVFEYNPSDEIKVAKMLDEIIKSIKFH